MRLAGIDRRPGVRYRRWCPMSAAPSGPWRRRADELNVTIATTQTFSQRHRMSVADSVAACGEVVRLAAPLGFPVACTISVGLRLSLYQGDVPDRVLDLVGRVVALGVAEVSLADTIGVANPRQVDALVAAVRARWPARCRSACTSTTRAGSGWRTCWPAWRPASALRCLGGGASAPALSPRGPRATSPPRTSSTSLDGLGVATGIDLAGLIAAARLVRDAVGHDVPSRMLAPPRPNLPAAT